MSREDDVAKPYMDFLVNKVALFFFQVNFAYIKRLI